MIMPHNTYIEILKDFEGETTINREYNKQLEFLCNSYEKCLNDKEHLKSILFDDKRQMTKKFKDLVIKYF
jgi:hypothetical protein